MQDTQQTNEKPKYKRLKEEIFNIAEKYRQLENSESKGGDKYRWAMLYFRKSESTNEFPADDELYCKIIIDAIRSYQSDVEEKFLIYGAWRDEKKKDTEFMKGCRERVAFEIEISCKLVEAYINAGIFESEEQAKDVLAILQDSYLASYGICEWLYKNNILECDLSGIDKGTVHLYKSLVGDVKCYEEIILNNISCLMSGYLFYDRTDALKKIMLLGRQRLNVGYEEKETNEFCSWCYYVKHMMSAVYRGQETHNKCRNVISKYIRFFTKEEREGVLRTFSWKELREDGIVRELVFLIIRESSYGKKKPVYGSQKNGVTKISSEAKQLMFYFLYLPRITYYMNDFLGCLLPEAYVSGLKGKGVFERAFRKSIEKVKREGAFLYDWPKNYIYSDLHMNDEESRSSNNENKTQSVNWIIGVQPNGRHSNHVMASWGKREFDEILFLVESVRDNNKDKVCFEAKGENTKRVIIDLEFSEAAIERFSDSECRSILEEVLERKLLDNNELRVSFLYLKNFRRMDEQSISFDHTFKYIHKKNNRRIARIKNEDNPGIKSVPNFYGRKVYSLTCLVGKNGAGKTSITDFLHDIFIPLKNYIDAGLISFQEIIHISKMLRNNSDELNDGNVLDDKIDIYERLGLDSKCEFIIVFKIGSRSYYLTNIDGIKVNENEGIEPYDEPDKGGHGAQTMQFFRFSGRIFPSGLRKVEELARRENYHFWERTDRNEESVRFFLDSELDIELNEEQVFVKSVDYSEEESNNNRLKEGEKKYFESVYLYQFIKDLIADTGLLEAVSMSDNYKEFLDHLNYSSKDNMKERIVYDNLEFFYEISKKRYVKQTEDGLEIFSIPFFMEGFRKLPKRFKGFLFPVSSGQYNRISFSSKLYFALSGDVERLRIPNDDLKELRGRIAQKGETVIMTIDEGEVYYHPEWQRTYVRNILNLINYAASNVTDGGVQIILTTNSPFLISELRTEDVFLLGEKGFIPEKGLGKTFGQNIHTLLQNTFFLQSTIGAFSREMITWLMTVLANPADIGERLVLLSESSREIDEKEIDLAEQRELMGEWDVIESKNSLSLEREKLNDQRIEIVAQTGIDKVLFMYCYCCNSGNKDSAQFEENLNIVKEVTEKYDGYNESLVQLVDGIAECYKRQKDEERWHEAEKEYVRYEVDRRFGLSHKESDNGYNLSQITTPERIIEALIEGVGEDLYRMELRKLYRDYMDRSLSLDIDGQIRYYQEKIALLRKSKREV